MTDYEKYREHVGITNPDMTETLRSAYPRYTRIDAHFVNHPEQHGLCLIPEAEKLLVETHGEGPGLLSVPFGKRKRGPENRKRQNRFTIRLNDDEMSRLSEMQKEMGLKTAQEMFVRLLDYAWSDFVLGGNIS